VTGSQIAQAWFSAAQLAGLPGMPGTERAVQFRAEKSGWTWQKRSGRGGGREYPLEVLPAETQAALMYSSDLPVTAGEPSAASSRTDTAASYDLDALQLHFDRAPQSMKDEAARKQRACMAIATLIDRKHSLANALDAVAMSANVPRGTLKNWWYSVRLAPRADWLLLLIDGYTGRTATADCSTDAWDWFKGQYLNRKAPTLADTYRRLMLIAPGKQWKVPSQKTLERRIETEVSPYTRTLLREGPEAMARMFPPQQRDRSVFAAGQAVNGDGLKFDKLWVVFEDGEILNTATAWFWQDINCGKVLAWRFGKTENTDIFRLSMWDLTGICLPEHVWVDNTRVAANKAMTAGAGNRHRFKDQPDDLTGALVQLGMVPHFTSPDHEMSNPGAKPVERAFGIGGIHDAVATHPRLINRGYSMATAIPAQELREILAEEVARLNAQEGRRSRVCGGILSFDQAWEKSFGNSLQRRASEAQRRLFLLMPEVVTVNRQNSVIALQVGRGPQGQHRYWCEALARFRGEKVVAYYDPDNLAAEVAIYSLDGRYLTQAQHLPGTGFNDVEAGREWAKNKARFLKAKKKAGAAEKRMSDLERAALYPSIKPEPGSPPPERKVVAAHFARVADPQRDLKRAAGHDVNDRFANAVERLRTARNNT